MKKKNKTIFIAIPIVEQLQMFASIQSYFARMLNSKIDPAKCIAAQDLHVTIAYIGLVSNENIRVISQAIHEAATQFALVRKPAYLLWHGQISLYNNAVALTFAHDEGLNLLANMVRNALAHHNISFDERFDFRAHTTIARIKPNHAIKKASIKRAILEILKQEHMFDLHVIKVDKIGIYASGEVDPFGIFNCT